jgi:membrane protease YdiL (CAAX protease family)
MKNRRTPKFTKLLLVITIGLALLAWVGTVRSDATLDQEVIQAAYRGDLALVKSLSERGADVNAKDQDARSALEQAKQSWNSEMVELATAHRASEAEATITVVRVAVSKLILVVAILFSIVYLPETSPEASAFFANQKWQLRDAYEIAVYVIFLIFLGSIFFPLWAGQPSSMDTIYWGGVCLLILAGYHSLLARRQSIRWLDFGIDKTRFLRGGVPALNIALVYFALLAAGVRIPLLNRLATESRLLNSWVDATIIGFALAFCEELLFRGILYAPVARRTGKWLAIVMLSLVECLIHLKLDVPQSGLMFVVFVIFYCVYIWTESLWAPLILHIGINVPLWQPMSMAATARYLPSNIEEFLYIYLPIFTLLIVDVCWLVNFMSRRTSSYIVE